MKAIVLVDNQWKIGDGTKCVADISEDRNFFRKMTYHKTVVMGRKTFETLPNGPLPERKNVILTRKEDYSVNSESATIVHSIRELRDSPNFDSMWAIGGSEIYSELFTFFDQIYVTKIMKNIPNMNKNFINLDKLPDWNIGWKSAPRYHNGLHYIFTEYYKSNQPKYNNTNSFYCVDESLPISLYN